MTGCTYVVKMEWVPKTSAERTALVPRPGRADDNDPLAASVRVRKLGQYPGALERSASEHQNIVGRFFDV